VRLADRAEKLEALTATQITKLVDTGFTEVKTLDDLADLASDELIEILGADAMDEETANAIIMAARQHWFEDTDGDGEAAVDEAAGDEVDGDLAPEEAAGEPVDGDGRPA
jgi:N utilization substance protein A